MAAPAKGSQAQLVSRFQDAETDVFKTPEPAGDGLFRALPFYSYDPGDSEEISEDTAISSTGDDDFPGDIVEGLRPVGGNVVVPLGPQSFGWWLAAMFGAPTTVDNTGGNYTHTFAAAGAMAPRNLTNGLHFTDVEQNFSQSGVTPTEMVLNLRKAGERDRATINFVGHIAGKTAANAVLDASPVAYTNDTPPTKFKATLQQRTGANDFAGTGDITGLDLTIGTGTVADMETMNGLATAEDIITGRWSGNGSITTRFKSGYWYDLAAAGTLLDIQIDWPVLASPARSLRLTLHNVRLAKRTPPVEGNGVITATWAFQIAKPASGNTPFSWRLQNQTANYANPTV